MVKINGEQKEYARVSLLECLEQEGYQVSRVVVERNLDIVPKEQYANIIIEDGDELEVVSFVGGG